MTISKRLQLLVLAAVLGLVLVAGMSWYQIEKVYSAANVSSASCMPGMVQLRNANIALSKIRIYIWVHISFDDAAKKEEVDKNIAGYQNDFDAALNAYEKNYIKDDKDRALLAIDRAEFAKYSINLNKIRELSSAHRKDEAFAMAMTIPTKAVAGAITSHFDYNVDVGAKADKEAQEVKAMALRMAIGIALASILAVFFVGFAVYRQINSGLRNAQHTITSIGSSLDFTLRADVKGRDEISQTLAVFNQLIERLQTNLRALQTGVREVAQTSGELLGASQQVAESSTTQSESSAHMAASVEQMTVSINHVAERAGEASHLSSAAGQSAQSGQQVIGQTVEDIHAIAQAVEAVAHDLHALEANSKEIETVVNVVRDVADQTNLLALNAAIEAARAGESGRGFAVVADEVRKLAERTTASTQEISAMIVAIQAASGTAVGRMREAVQRVEQGVARAGSAEQSMSAIFDSSSQSVRLVSEITEAIREQGGATNTIASQVESVAQMAEENSSAASQAAAMAQRLEEVSTNMHGIVAAFRLA